MTRRISPHHSPVLLIALMAGSGLGQWTEAPQRRYIGDVGITRIISPPETLWDTTRYWQSEVEVHNFGDSAENRMLECLYMWDTVFRSAETLQLVGLAGGTTDTLEFLGLGRYPGSWLAFRLTPHDLNPANDSAAVRPVFIATKDIGVSWRIEPPESAEIGYRFPVEAWIANHSEYAAGVSFVEEWYWGESLRFSQVYGMTLDPGDRTLWGSAHIPVYVVDTSSHGWESARFYINSWNANPDNDTLHLYIRPIITGLSEQGIGAVSRSAPTPSVLRDILTLPILPSASRASLLDPSGRMVMDLQPGPNDIRHVAPGVYFLRPEDSGRRPAVTKIVVQ